MTKSPAFQFYPDDFVGGRPGMMTPEEVGVYTLLLCADWNQNGFVFDPKSLARWCRTSPRKFLKAWAVVRENFVERGGRMFNPRLEIERAKQHAWREKSRKGGTKGGGDHRPTTIATKEQPKTDTPSPSPSPSPTEPTATTPLPLPRAREKPEPETRQLVGVRARLPSDQDRISLDHLLASLPNAVARTTWVAEIAASLDGMSGHVGTTAEQMARAIADCLGNGATQNPNLRQFRRYLESAVRESQPLERSPPSYNREPRTISERIMAKAKAAGMLDDPPETETT